LEDIDMAKIRSLVIGGAVGVAVTYFFDPERGSSRRAELQEQVGAYLRRSVDRLDNAARQVQRRPRAGAQLKPADVRPLPEEDLTLLSRVESVLLAMPGFPKSSVEAEVSNGRLTLRGEVASADQAQEIVEAASRVRNVGEVENQLRIRSAQATVRKARRVPS
jgi:osmotically-inducible protein OsmY